MALVNADGPAALRLIELVHGAAVTHVVGAVAMLGVVDHLSDGPRPVAELATATGTDASSLRRLLRAATALGLIERVPGDSVAVTAAGRWLREAPGSLRNFALAHAAPGQLRPPEQLAEAVRSGRAVAEAALGQGIWDYYRDHPVEGGLFAGAMSGLSALIAGEVAAAVDLTGRRRIVDVGGGHGVLLAALLATAPAASGVLVDLPEVVADAEPIERVEFVAGDFFRDVPAGGDAYLLSHVLHDWEDQRAEMILRACHHAARPDSVLFVVEAVLAEEPGPVGPELVDLLMLCHLGGRERTHLQYQRLLGAAGWRLETANTLRSGQSVLRARRCS
jgi:SAM-dependent methyltransferase